MGIYKAEKWKSPSAPPIPFSWSNHCDSLFAQLSGLIKHTNLKEKEIQH